MTRQEHLNFCKQCLNRKFDPQKGIICSITSKVADFDRTCANFIQDEQVEISQSVSEEELPVTLMEISEDVKQKIRVHQDISFALIGGLLAAVVSAVIWAVITVTFEYQIAYMAIGVGLLVGFTRY